MSFGEVLKNLRKEKSITQQELADYLMFTRATIAHYETGRKEPEFDTLKKIAEYFDVSIDYLLGRTDIRNPYTDNNKKNSEEDDIYNIIDELPEEELEELKKYAQYLKVKSALEKADKESSATLDDAG